MNKEEQLRIYSAYLPYKLQVIRNGEQDPETLRSVKCHWHKNTGSTEFNEYHLENIKPILYDLSYLTKEIEHEGETFVPTERLMNYASNFGVHRGVFEHMLSSILDGNTYITELPYYLIIKLLEWHLNVFGLPEEQFINKATLTNK